MKGAHVAAPFHCQVGIMPRYRSAMAGIRMHAILILSVIRSERWDRSGLVGPVQEAPTTLLPGVTYSRIKVPS
jgi:hypothetical protein